MTDIDTLIAYAKRELTSYPQLSRAETNALIDALITERTKVAALEAEVERLREALEICADDHAEGGAHKVARTCLDRVERADPAARKAWGDWFCSEDYKREKVKP